MDHMGLISRNLDDVSINLLDPRILAAKTSQKDNLRLGETMKYYDRENLLKELEEEIKYLTTEDV